MLLKLSDVMRNAGLNPKEVKLARHPMSDKDAKFCYENGFFELYLKTQGKKRFENCRYILNFVGTQGTLGRYESACFHASQQTSDFYEPIVSCSIGLA